MTAQLSDGERAYLRVVGLPAVVRQDGSVVEFSATQRRILARLGLDAPRPVSLDELVHAVWDAAPPASARQAIQNQISRVRQGVTDVMPDLIATVGDSYALTGVTDAQLMRDLATAAEQALAAGDARAAYDLAEAALELWRGEPFSEIAHVEGVSGFRRASHAACDGAHDLRLEAALHLGMRSWAHAEAERLVANTPTDERRASLLARALALTGRRADALAVLADCRRRLRTELGLEPGPFLAGAERDILNGNAVPTGGDAAVPAQRQSPPPLMGRRDDLRRILQAVAQRLPVLVSGEAGVGISRMLFELRARLAGLGVRAVLVRAEEHPHSATSLVEEMLSELGVPRDPTQNAISAFASVAAAIDADHPTVFLIDDVQFLGPSAWQAIVAVAEADFGGLVLGSHGPVLRLDNEHRVPLAPLGEEDTAVIVRHWGVTDPDAVHRIYEMSGGNPLAARLLACSPASAHETTGGSPVPLGLATPAELAAFGGFLQQLVGELDADRRHDLQLAAVAGDGYPMAALTRVTWEHPLQFPPGLAEVDDDGALRFRHGAVRAHAYRSLPRGVLLDLHYALGVAAREIGAPAGTVARHLLLAAELDPEAAIDAAREAAREATLLGAHADAAAWLAQACEFVDSLACSDSPPGSREKGDALGTQSVALAIEHADALRLAGDTGHLPALFAATRRALESGDDTLTAAAGFALLQLGASSPAGGPDPEVTALTAEVIQSIDDPQRRAPVQAAASLAWSMTGHAETARSLFEEAEAAAVDPAVRLAVLPFAYLALGRPVDLPRRAALAAELVALARAAEAPIPLWEGLHLTFSVAMQHGDGPGMRAALGEMETLIDRIGDVGRRWSMLYCAATLAEIDGDLDRSELLAAQAHSVFAPVSPDRAAAALYGQLLPLRWRQGRLAEVRPLVEQLVTAQPGVTAWHAAAALVLADAAGPATDPVQEADLRATARHHAELALELAQDDFLWLAAHVVGGRAAAMLGAVDLVDRYRLRLEPWAELVCWQGTCSYGPVAGVLSLLAGAAGDRDAAGAYAARAAGLTAALAAR